MQPGKAVPIRQGIDLQVSHTAGDQPAVVFLHGGLGNRFNWRSQFEFAQIQGWQALAYDLAGHGSSSPYRRYSIGRHCRDLSRLLQQLAIEAPILCCHSYGVPIGLEWATRHPVTGLILIAGGSHGLAPWWEPPVMTLMAIGLRHLFTWPILQQGAQSIISAHRSARIDRYFADNPIPTDRQAYEALQIFWTYDLFARKGTENLWNTPILTITGGCDPTFSQVMGAALCSHFAHSRHLHFPKAGHIVMAEYPEEVNAAIKQWRKEISSR